MNILLAGVIYPEVEIHLSQYFNSIRNQNFKDFDFILINDGCDYHKKDLNINGNFIYYDDLQLTAAKIREFILNYAIYNNYDILIFSDTDDYFSKNRIRKAVDKLSINKFIYNRLVMIDKTKEQKIELPNTIGNFKDIVNQNFIGLGHSSINLKNLSKINIPQNIIAVDWFIYSVLLLNNYSGMYDKESITYYRQTENNIVGAEQKLTKKRLRFGIKVKKIHYQAMINYCNQNNLIDEQNIYSSELKKIDNLEKKINQNNYIEEYIFVINNHFNQIYSGWWSEILPLNEWRKYAK